VPPLPKTLLEAESDARLIDIRTPLTHERYDL
jgi:hypothetical protein